MCGDDSELANEILLWLESDYRYAADLRRWIVRDGVRWVPAPEGIAPYIAACAGRTRPHPMAGRPDVRTWARQGYHGGAFTIGTLYGLKSIGADDMKASYTAERMQAPAAQARVAMLAERMVRYPDPENDARPAVRTSDLDQEPHILWAGSVPFDLARSVTEPVWATDDYGPERLPMTMAHMLSAGYCPDIRVPVPVWEELTAAIFPDDGEREHALNALAHGLHGYPTPAAILARSATGTGKSLLASLLADLLGDYAGQVSAATLFGQSGSSQFAFDEMAGARFVVMNEGRKADFAATEAFKAVVGPDPLVNARARHERRRRLVPARHTLMLTVNPAADLDYSDPAVRRRLVPAGFAGDPAKIAAIAARYGTASPEGRAAWQAEAPGVLARMIVRCAWVLADLAHRGTRADAPESVMAGFDAMAAEADPFGRWLAERTGDGLPTANAALLADYRRWCAGAGEEPVNATWFGRALASAGIQRAKLDRETRGWRIALR
jgi:phage/plasmid-associated DNA primase